MVLTPSVVLINPRSPHTIPEAFGIPLGLAYIGATLCENNIQVSGIDLCVDSPMEKCISRVIQKQDPSIVGITCVTSTFPEAIKVASFIKEHFPNIYTVMGGVHPTFTFKEILNEYNCIDFVVRGEGEQTMLELAKNLGSESNPAQVKGIAFKREGSVVSTPLRPLIDDLDLLPFPKRRMFSIRKYQKDYTGMISGRGCPFSCIFCSCSMMWQRRSRFRSINNVVDEMEHVIYDLGFKRVYMEDDTFTLSRQRITDFCNELKNRKIDIEWACNARVDTVSKDLLSKMAESGCITINFGVESGSQRILDVLRKQITLRQVRKAIAWAKEAGIGVKASFIIGLPFETGEDAVKTISLAEELDVEGVSFNALIPYPGTEVFENASQYGIRIIERDWAKFYPSTRQSLIETSEMSSREIDKLLRFALERFKSLGYIDLEPSANGKSEKTLVSECV